MVAKANHKKGPKNYRKCGIQMAQKLNILPIHIKSQCSFEAFFSFSGCLKYSGSCICQLVKRIKNI